MPNKLKDLSVTSVDLVDQGANPDAHIRLFKRHEPQELDPDEGFFRKFFRWMKKAFEDEDDQEDGPDDEPEGNETEEEETDTMKIDKSRMTPEEQATLAEFEKKYGMADKPEGTEQPAPEGGVTKGGEPAPTPTIPSQGAQPAPMPVVPPQGAQPVPIPTVPPQGAELHPDVAKALSEFQELTKRQSAEVEELKKSLEIERLTASAQKYEVLGKKAPELAAKLYELKKAGGTFYDDYVKLLDESLAAVNKSGMFGEIGSNRQGSAGTEQTIGIKARELQKSASGGMSTPEAIVKAFEENPDLAEQYEAEYMGR